MSSSASSAVELRARVRWRARSPSVRYVIPPEVARFLTMRSRWLLLLALTLPAPTEAQRFGRSFEVEPNAKYDGRFTFARIRYTVYRRSGWEFDYPTMERNLMLMRSEEHTSELQSPC